MKSGVPFIAAIAPSAPLSAAGLYGRVQSSLEARLGPMVTMALLIGLGLILGLFLVRWAFGRMAKAKG